MFLLFSKLFDSTDPKKIIMAFVTHGGIVFVHREVISFAVGFMVLF
jgi:hypothetical protein